MRKKKWKIDWDSRKTIGITFILALMSIAGIFNWILDDPTEKALIWFGMSVISGFIFLWMA